MSDTSILGIIKKITPDDFFIWMKPFYMLHGFLPPKQGIFRYIYITFATTYFGLLAVELVSQWFSIFKEFSKSGLEHIPLQITISVFTTIFHFRILMWLLNNNKMSQIVEIISRKSFHFECFGISSVRSVNVYRTEKVEEIPNVLEYYKYLSNLWNTNGIFHFENGRYVQYFQ